MSDDVTHWLDELREHNASAAENLWRYYFVRLHGLARRNLSPDTRRVYDEEDAAQSAFLSFCQGIEAGRFPELKDRDSLWRLLVVITARKVRERHQFDRREKRDIRRVVTDSQIPAVTAPDRSWESLEQLAGREPTPEFAAEFSETCERLFDGLPDGSLRDVAALKLQGLTDDEVGQQLQCARRTVQRRLEVIRRAWRKILTES